MKALFESKKRKKRIGFFQKNAPKARVFLLFFVFYRILILIFSWNMSRSKQKQPSIFTPAILFLMFLASASYFIWNTYYVPQGIVTETDIIQNGDTVLVRLGQSDNFFETKVDTLLEGESIRSVEGGAQLRFFDGTVLTLDSGATATIELARSREKDSAELISLRLEEGRAFLSAEQKINPQSEVSLSTEIFDIKTKGGDFSIDQNEVIALSGSAMLQVGGLYGEEIEVGQAIQFTEEDIAEIESGGSGPQKTAIPADFQNSEWFAKNMSGEEIPESDLDLDTLEQEPALNEETAIETEEENEEIGVVILSPGANDEVVETTEDNIPLSGTVPEGTEKVIVNDYTLSRFSPGDTTFQYNAATQWGTLEEGRNEYTVVALGDDGERYEAEITIVYAPEGTAETAEDTPEESETAEESLPEEDEAVEEPESNDSESEDNEIINGDLTITTPEEGEEMSEDLIEVTGGAPSNAVDIRVNDYVLSAFSEGDETWLYRISSAIGNRTAGEYTITAEALDAEGNVLQTTTRNFLIEPLSGTNEKYMPEMRGGTLPPVEQDDTGGPTI
jgi:hypothetical protein